LRCRPLQGAQGFSKKIDVQLLAAYQPFELGDLNRRWYNGQFPSRPPGTSPAANGTKKRVPALPGAFLANAGFAGGRQGHGMVRLLCAGT